MHSKQQFFRTLWSALALATAVTFIVGMLVVPAFAQNASQAAAHNNVPPTARQAATLPQFVSRLARHVSPEGASKRRTSTRACSNRASGQLFPQDGIIYDNGPANGTTDAWTINFGYVVSDSIPLASGNTVTGFDLYTWEFPGDIMSSVDWSITSDPNGGNVLGSGTANVVDTYISTNQYGYNIDYVSASGLNVNATGTVWLNLQNAAVPSGDPIYWDENSGPSQAYESSVGTIPSEAFDITGGGSGCMREHDGKFKVIHNFSGKGDGSFPYGVAIDGAGNLYGPTSPQSGSESVFRLSPSGSGWVLDTLYNFAGGGAGSLLHNVIIGLNGVLYGGAYGGVQGCSQGNSCDFIFGLQPSATACRNTSCSWNENTIYSFTGPTDAWGGVGLVSDQAGNLYGVSPLGGALQKGAIFELTPSAGGWVESILYSFTGDNDDENPTSVLVGKGGNLYGTTQAWAGNSGVVFQLTPSGGGWTETVIADFSNPWGPPRLTSLVQDSLGNLFFGGTVWSPYGTSYSTIVELIPSNGTWTGKVLFWNYWNTGYDGFFSLAMDRAGDIYGVGGGWSGCAEPVYHGYIWKLSRIGNNDWWVGYPPAYWDNTKFDAFGTTAVDAQGNLYGTTYDCGNGNNGTVWQVSP